jgi:uncharacterized protein (DUF362 family)
MGPKLLLEVFKLSQIDPQKVYIVRTPLEDNVAAFDTYRELASRALGAASFELPANGKVLLKPNATVLFPPDKRIITHPGFLAGMIDALLEKGIPAERLVVAEGQSGEQADEGHTWEKCGYAPTLRQLEVPLISLNEAPSRSIEVPDGVVYKEYPVYSEILDCAFFFNVPLAKCHNLGCTTLAIKNLMGILDRPERHLCAMQEVDKPFEDGIWRLTDSGLSLFEDRFYHKLCDIVVALRQLGKPQLCVVDGLIGRDGTAFNEGDNYPLGWSLVGVNEVHVDTIATYLMGLDPLETPYLRVAAQRGLGTNRVGDIEVVDLESGEAFDPARLRRAEPLMPVCRYGDDYYPRFRADGSAVPWRLDRVNEQRRADGLETLAVDRINGG